MRAWAWLLCLPALACAEPVTYRLDARHSFVQFEVLHFGTSTLRGRLGPVDGQVTLDRTAGRGELGVSVPTASVDTGVAALDARLRGPLGFASDAHPQAFFVATRFEFDGERVARVRGEFTLRGTSAPLELKALRFACRDQACGGDFEAELQRSEFGITDGLPFVGDTVRLLVQVEAIPR